MKFELTEKKTFCSYDYDEFKKLLGNRDVKEERVQGIIESIEKVGYLPSPILVNEKFEVIDGQGRLEACKRLQLPVEFMIKDGIGIEECIAMNIKMKNWDIYDYINSYTVQGNENYTQLQDYANRFENLNIIEVAMCLSEAMSKNIQRPLRDGRYVIVLNDNTYGCLEFISKCASVLKNIRGGTQQYIPVLVGLYKMCLIDEARMAESITAHYGTMGSAYNADDALTELQNVYNYHRRYNEYFRDEYLRRMESAGARYGGGAKMED